MKPILYLLPLIGLLLMTSACNNEKISYDHTFTLTSSITGFDYKVDVLKTAGTGQEYMFFVMDGNDLMPIIEQQIEKLNPAVSVTFVGLTYPGPDKRARDYTISERGKETGMAPELLQFIQFQLDSTLMAEGIYASNTHRGIMGHSLGGLFGSYCFSSANSFFDNYLILSPALFWDDYRYFSVEQQTRAENKNTDARVFLGIGEAEDLGMNNIFEHFRLLIAKEYPGVSLQSHVAEGSHFNSRDENIFNGLQFLLR